MHPTRVELADRLHALRIARYGDDLEAAAAAAGVPPRTWRNYEAGVMIPGEVLVRFLAAAGVLPTGLLTCPPGEASGEGRSAAG